MKRKEHRVGVCLLSAFVLLMGHAVHAQEGAKTSDLDGRVEAFLHRREGDWHDMNVPAADGQILHDLILKHKYRRALEIGTSTGHSAIWMAWALAKTGGKLTTIEIDEGRYATALEHFAEAGLSEYIDARLADAHELVPVLKGPFDFVFCDADKEWYWNYFEAVAPKLEVGGRYTAHNVSLRGWGSAGIREFVDRVRGLPNFETTLEPSSRSGISISRKKSEK